jgi:uncharacterized membrane protein
VRPGFFFRDRGLLGWMEVVVIAGFGLALMLFDGTFSHASTAFLAFFAVCVALTIALWIVGAWRRKKALAAYRDSV